MIRPLLIILAVAVPALLVFESYLTTFFRFDPVKLQQLSQQSIAKYGDDVEGLMRDLVPRLQAEYGPIVRDFDNNEWVFNVAGGSCGAMMIIHASITEYLLLFGSAAGTEGHSGAHFAHDYFTILHGRQTAGFLGELKPRVFMPGDQHHHPRGHTAHYTLDNSTWALELAQGYIPSMMPFGLIQMPLTLDVGSTFRTIWYTGRNVVQNMFLHGKI